MNVKTVATSNLSLETANALMVEIRRACEARGFAPAIAIADAGGHLRAFERADAAPFLTAEVAVNKAWTSAAYGLSTHDWNKYMGEPTVAPLAHHPRLMPVGGGLPFHIDGKLAGGIGISGGTSLQDHEAGEDALRSLGLLA